MFIGSLRSSIPSPSTIQDPSASFWILIPNFFIISIKFRTFFDSKRPLILLFPVAKQDKIIEKYECGQEVIDRIVSELIHRRHIEGNKDGTNRYKIINDRADVSNLCFYIEYRLHL